MPTMPGSANPTAQEFEVDGFAHCGNPMCPGYGQETVKAVKTIVERSYQAGGGDWAFTEGSSEYLRFADESEQPCTECGALRMVTDQQRPTYQPLSGYPQNGLLHVKRISDTPAAAVDDGKTARLEAQVAELQSMVNKFVAKDENVKEED